MRYPMRLHPDKYFIWIKHNFDDAQKIILIQFEPWMTKYIPFHETGGLVISQTRLLSVGNCWHTYREW